MAMKSHRTSTNSAKTARPSFVTVARKLPPMCELSSLAACARSIGIQTVLTRLWRCLRS